MASSGDEASEKECPLCMEPLELDDLNFYPCKCEYQICRFCWHRIRTDENGLCPACRQAYPEDPVNFKPLSAEELQRIKSEKKQKQQQHKQKVSESRKHLANLRVLQKNLVYVVGLSPRIADAETLKKPEYFGKYGRIHKVVVGSAIGAQSSNCTAYVTYYRAEDALKAIQNVNNVNVDGRTVKASLGTTKYCSSYLRNQPCHKVDCMYLHDVAEEDASFTKEDMHQGRHTEYERKLHDLMASQIQQNRRGDSSSSSPKDSGYFDQQISNDITDENDLFSNRQSRLHNQPPRHRGRQGNREKSKSSERDKNSLENGSLVYDRDASPGDFGSSVPLEQIHRPLSEEQNILNSQRQQMSIPSQSVAVAVVDWPGRLLAAMQQQANNQSLFSQDETIFARQAQAKQAAAVQLPMSYSSSSHCPSISEQQNLLEGHQQQHNLQTTNASSSNGIDSSLREVLEKVTVSGGCANSGQNSTLENQTGRIRNYPTEHQPFPLRPNQTCVNGVAEHQTQKNISKTGNDDSVVLSDAALTVQSQTDWQAAFGLVNNDIASTSTSGQVHPVQVIHQMKPSFPVSLHDDDLGFDPFSISAKGLADLLEEEQAEKEREKAMREQQQREQENLHLNQSNTQNSIANNFGAESWNGSAGGYFSAQQLSPNSTGHHFQQQNSICCEGLLRPSPVPHQFTTPPPGFPPAAVENSNGGKSFQNGPVYGGGFNGVRQPSARHLQLHSQGMAAGPPPPPPFLSGFLPGGAREPSPTHTLPPRGPARSVSPHGPLGKESYNMKEWQEGLRAMLPGVNVQFAPGLGANSCQQGPAKTNPNWMGPRHPHPIGHPFTQPPPPLQVSTSGPVACPPGMRHSPPGGDPYCIPPPPLGGPRPPGSGGMPPVYPSGGPWASLTPPPPGFSPRQQSL